MCSGLQNSMGLFKYAAFFISEFLCSSLLIICTCLASSSLNNAIVPMSIAYGLINLVLTSCFGQISGGFANPAVAFAFWWRGYMPMKRLLVYIAAEISGAAIGHNVVNRLLGKAPSDTLCIFAPKAGLPDKSIMGAEFLLTFLLVMTWCVLWDYEGDLPMELYLVAANTLVCLLGGYLTGASTNPARTIAPLFFVKKSEKAQVCLTGQILAGLAAPFLWSCLQFWTKF